MSADVSKVTSAFKDGSGLAPEDIQLTIAVAIIGLIFVFGIGVLFKRLSAFQKDDNTSELMRTVGLVFIAIIIILFFIALLTGASF